MKEHAAEFKPAIGVRCGLVLSSCWRAEASLVQRDRYALQLVTKVNRPGCAPLWGHASDMGVWF